MKRFAMIVLGLLLAVGFAASARAAEADPVQWRIVPGGHPIPNNDWLSLFNKEARGFLEVGKRTFGVNLRYGVRAPKTWKLATKDTSGVVRYGDAVCLREMGGRSLVYAKRKAGVDLGWAHDKVYEWEVRGGTPGEVVGAGEDTTDVSLYNMKSGAYLVYGKQDPGVDLKWHKE